MADVALVGFPSAGKSTLISVISRAKPKIADYPFTTLEPNLGVVVVGESEFVVADLPGLIKGASEGAGLGDRFLRHIERARVLVYLLDLSSIDGASPIEQLDVLQKELGNYQPSLLERPSIVVGSKADVLTADDWGRDAPVDMVISSATNQGIDQLKWRLLELVQEARAAEPEREGFVIHRPEAIGVELVRDDDGAWRIVGRAAERAVALSDLTDVGALDYARNRLKKLGVDKALKRAGLRNGDEVRIGEFAFEYEEDM
jgi:GTP-binding protein